MTAFSSILGRIQILKQIPIFSKLNWFDLQKLARKSQLTEYKKGDIIRKQGDPPDNFYCLVSGRLQAYHSNAAGEKTNLEFIHRGMHFGIISLFTGENHSLTFEALNDSVVLTIERNDFHKILKGISSLGIEFSQSLSQRMRSHVAGGKTVFESNIISIYSPVQGAGSSTYAIHLALSLEKETKKKVVLVNVHAEQEEGEEEKDVVSPKWKNAIRLKDIVGDHDKVFESIAKDELDIHLLNVMFDPADPSLKKMISPLVSTLVGAYHYVIVDLPNNMDEFVVETLTQSDSIHLLCLDKRKELQLLRKVIDRIELIFKERFRPEKLRVIIRSVREHTYLSFDEINKTIDFPVTMVLPYIKTSELKPEIESKHVRLFSGDEDMAYKKVVTRAAREIGGVMVGVVLGGGAALGVAHIGFIRVLEQNNIPVDVIVGSSMGALVGGLWSLGKTADELEAIAHEFEKTSQMLKLFDPPLSVMPISGLVRGHAIRRWLKKHYGSNTFYGCRTPFKAVAYDLTMREELVLDSGSLVDAVCQSIAIPGVIPPIKDKHRIIIDGGVLNPLPTNVLSSRGIKKIIAVNVLQSPDDMAEGYAIEMKKLQDDLETPFIKAPAKYIGLRLGRFISKPFRPNIADIIVQTLQASEYVIAEQSANIADINIHPDLVGINWYELYKVDELISRGEEAARAVLPQIQSLIES